MIPAPRQPACSNALAGRHRRGCCRVAAAEPQEPVRPHRAAGAAPAQLPPAHQVLPVQWERGAAPTCSTSRQYGSHHAAVTSPQSVASAVSGPGSPSQTARSCARRRRARAATTARAAPSSTLRIRTSSTVGHYLESGVNLQGNLQTTFPAPLFCCTPLSLLLGRGCQQK